MSNEAHISAQSNQKKTQARLPKPDEHQGGTRDLEPPPGEGTLASHGLGGLEVGATVPPPARFQRADRVISARDYARVRRQGGRAASKNFAVSIAARDEEVPGQDGSGNKSRTRLGLIVSRKVGNAVVRNRVKRSIREWFRTTGTRLAEGVDIVVIARQGAANKLSSEIWRELSSLFAKGLPKSPAVTKSGVRK